MSYTPNSHKNKITFLARVVESMRATSTMGLAAYFIFAGFLVYGLGALIVTNISGIDLLVVRGLAIIGAFFFWGCAGVVWAVRRERPDLITLRGIPAIIVGVIVAVFFWGWALWAFWRLLNYFIASFGAK